MEHYKYDTANNIIALASMRARHDPHQSDDNLKFVLLKEIGKPMFNQKVDINTIKKSFKYLNEFS